MLTATGVALYLGYGGWVVTVHAALALVTLGYIFVHVFTHYMYGGLQQLLRLFRATRLPENVRLKQPLIIAALAGVAVAFGVTMLDYVTRDTLKVARVSEAPKLDGVLDDAVWRNARVVSVRTEQGSNLGGSGESIVQIRAVQDGKKIHFALRWQDPTRSVARLPLVEARGRLAHAGRARRHRRRGELVRGQVRHAVQPFRRVRQWRHDPYGTQSPSRRAQARARLAATTTRPMARSPTYGSGRRRAAACSATSTTSISARPIPPTTP